MTITPERACTCHPDDFPPVPCERLYAFRDCQLAACTRELQSARAQIAGLRELVRQVYEATDMDGWSEDECYAWNSAARAALRGDKP
jgi:hypothetical protein